jgi:hypothetical protein
MNSRNNTSYRAKAQSSIRLGLKFPLMSIWRYKEGSLRRNLKFLLVLVTDTDERAPVPAWRRNGETKTCEQRDHASHGEYAESNAAGKGSADHLVHHRALFEEGAERVTVLITQRSLIQTQPRNQSEFAFDSPSSIPDA